MRLDICENPVLVLHNPRPQKHLGAATMQAFAFTYELSFKRLKRYLALASPNPVEIDDWAFNNVIREACNQNLVWSGLPVWGEYRRSRGTTGHTCNEEKAEEVFAHLPDFLEDARYLLNRLQGKLGPLTSPVDIRSDHLRIVQDVLRKHLSI